MLQEGEEGTTFLEWQRRKSEAKLWIYFVPITNTLSPCLTRSHWTVSVCTIQVGRPWALPRPSPPRWQSPSGCLRTPLWSGARLSRCPTSAQPATSMEFSSEKDWAFYIFQIYILRVNMQIDENILSFSRGLASLAPTPVGQLGGDRLPWKLWFFVS